MEHKTWNKTTEFFVMCSMLCVMPENKKR